MYHLFFSITAPVADMDSSGKDPPSPLTESTKMDDTPVEGACGLQSLDSLSFPSSDPDDLLVCGICEELYDDDTRQPKFLSCHHTVCAHCLDKLSNKEQPNPASIQCPNCRSNTQLPENGVHGLQTNFYIARIKNVSKIQEEPKTPRTIEHCHRHINQTKSYFCVTCGISTCCDCIVTDHTATAGHSVIIISEEESTYLQELNTSHNTLALNKKNLQLIKSEMALLAAGKEAAIKDTERCIQLVSKQLDQRKDDLRNIILDQFNVLQNNLVHKQNQIQEATKILDENIAKAKTVTKSGDLNDLKPISDSLKKVNEKMLGSFSKLELGKNYMEFEYSTHISEFTKHFSTIGKSCVKKTLPTKIAFRGREMKSGYKAILTAEVYDHHDEQVTIPSDSLSVEVTDPRNTKLQTDIRIAGSEYTVTFEPKVGGLHKICWMFLGEKLTSKQTHISVRSTKPVLKFGKYGYGYGEGSFRGPWAIAIDNNNCLYVADTQNHLIQKFTADGRFLSQFSLAVHNKDHTTCDIALDLNKGWITCPEIVHGEFLKGANSILVFNLAGELVHTYSLTSTSFPFSIAISRHGDIITCDIHKKSLYKVDGSSTLLCHMQEINSPGYISINDDDSIIVPDRSKDCIYIFNPDGTVRHRFGSSGTGMGQLRGPYGIASDGEYILVTEEKNNRLQVFKYDGTFVSMIGNGEEPLLTPRGITVTKDGHVYVVDHGNNCIKKYKYKDMAWWQSVAWSDHTRSQAMGEGAAVVFSLPTGCLLKYVRTLTTALHLLTVMSHERCDVSGDSCCSCLNKL